MRSSIMKVLITGGAVFIGHNAAIFLRSRSFEVVAFDNLKRSTEYAINRLRISGIPIVKGDILNAVALRKALNGVGDR